MKVKGGKLYLTVVLLFLYIPIIVLVIYSFNKAKYSLVWHGFTTNWYQLLFENRDLWLAFLHSIFLGLAASILATTIGALASIRLYLTNTTSKSIIGLLYVMIIVPDIVFGIALLIFFNYMHISLGFFSLLIAHITFCIPFVVILINARFATLDSNLYLAAYNLGASTNKTLITIILPLLMPALISSFLLSFTLSFDDIIISYFVSGPSFEILPLTIYSMVRTGITPEINALCTITFSISLVIVLTAQYFLTKNKQ